LAERAQGFLRVEVTVGNEIEIGTTKSPVGIAQALGRLALQVFAEEKSEEGRAKREVGRKLSALRSPLCALRSPPKS